jgi:uncharacterized protein (DUF427 family)
MSRSKLIPGPDHPITIEATGARVVVRAAGQVVADSTNALTLQEANYPAVQYVPLADVDRSLLRPTSTSTYCPYKGDCSYYTIARSGTDDLVDAVWSYSAPYPAVAAIAGHVAFYTDRVELSVS